ncbi:MAG: hypothetical protein KC486_32980 [Myxococcales bacterium]|nr:hypothetical protein [Myxococcales bacterium]
MNARTPTFTTLRSTFCQALAVALCASALTACDDAEVIDETENLISPKGQEITALPVFEYKGSAVTPEQAEALAAALKLPINALNKEGLIDENGAIRFMDEARFLHIPTKSVPFQGAEDEEKNEVSGEAPALDFAALEALKVLPDEEAIGLSKEILGAVDLGIPGAKAVVSHASLELRDVNDKPILDRAIDTTVHHEQFLAGLPLTGSGAKVKLVFDGEGKVAQLTYARPVLEKTGSVAIVPQSSAAELCAESLAAESLQGAVKYSAKLIYDVPADAKVGATILPSYACSGTQEVDGQVVELRESVIPAVLDQPKATISVTPGPGALIASAEVDGGVAPYTYEWIREGGDRALSPEEAAAEQIEYAVTSREPVDAVRETLRLVVTDANGVRTEARADALVPAPVWSAPQTPRVGGVRDAGAEWVGSCGGLGGSQNNAGGFVNKMTADGVNVRFNFGNFSAWERDFRDDDFGGNDDSYVDNTDFVFYTGHANGDGFTFCGENDDTFLRFDEARWGNDHDLEWLVIAACGPLQETSGGRSWADRWGPAFDRLHLLMAYATVSRDNTTEGRKLATYMTKSSPLDVHRAWIQTATDVQPSSVTYAVMGVIGQGFTFPNLGERFWGHGSVGADVPASDVIGYWRIAGAS